MSEPSNENDVRGMEVEVIDIGDGSWLVEAIDTSVGGEGQVFMALFEGAKAEERACEYAAWRYGFGGNG